MVISVVIALGIAAYLSPGLVQADVHLDEGTVYVLNFQNRDREAMILDVDAWVLAADWLPRRLVFKEADGRVVAELNAEQLVIDQGLDPDDVRALPEDAEVIDNRRR